MPFKNAPVLEAMKSISGQYSRFGFRRIRVMLERQGIMLGKERCAALWRQGWSASFGKAPTRRIAEG